MVRVQKRRPRPLVLEEDLEVQVRPVPFRTFASLRHLDVERLSRAAHARFEVGWFETDCCRRVVHAVVRKGKVAVLDDEPCPDPLRITPELEQLIRKAAREFRPSPKRAPRLPMPVGEFLASAQAITIQVKGCIKICVLGRCVWCCFTNSPRWWAKCGVGSKRPDV